MSYLDELRAELTSAGVPAGRRRRIIDEFSDHLHENPAAQLGEPRVLARQFADELGTRLARTAAFRVFAALAFTAVSLAALVLAIYPARKIAFNAHSLASPGWAAPILIIAVLAAQVALAAGGLALLRAWRLWHAPVINRAEATILARRAAVAGVCGAVTAAVLPTFALAFARDVGQTWVVCAWIAFGLALTGLGATVPNLFSAARLRPRVAGEAPDMTADLGPWLAARLTPRRVLLLVVLLIVVVITAAGIVADDGYDGALRGIFDGLACLVGYLALGRYLGLRSAR